MPNTNKRYIATIAFSALCCGTAQAYYPLITDDTGTQGMGGHQLEFAYERSKARNRILNDQGAVTGEETARSSVVQMSYTYGITETADIFLGGTRQTSPDDGWQNTELGLKWALAGSQQEGWSLGLKSSLILPVSEQAKDRGFGNAKTNWSAVAIATYLADDYEFHVNAGYASNRDSARQDETARRSLWNASIAPVIVLNDQWKLGVEAGLQTNPDYASKTVAFGGVGLVYAPFKNMQIGSALHTFSAIDARDKSRSHAVTVGLTVQF